MWIIAVTQSTNALDYVFFRYGQLRCVEWERLQADKVLTASSPRKNWRSFPRCPTSLSMSPPVRGDSGPDRCRFLNSTSPHRDVMYHTMSPLSVPSSHQALQSDPVCDIYKYINPTPRSHFVPPLRPREIPAAMHVAAIALIFALPTIRNSQVRGAAGRGAHSRSAALLRTLSSQTNFISPGGQPLLVPRRGAALFLIVLAVAAAFIRPFHPPPPRPAPAPPP